MQEKITVLGLDHVKTAFFIYLSGLCLAVLTFIMETVLGRKKSSGTMEKSGSTNPGLVDKKRGILC